jgi:hypothetical protein
MAAQRRDQARAVRFFESEFLDGVLYADPPNTATAAFSARPGFIIAAAERAPR